MLTHEDVTKIAHLQIDILKGRLADRQIELSVSDEALEKIASLGYEKEFGARPLKRAIAQYISVPISQELLKHPEKKKLSITLKNDALAIS